MMTQSTQTQVKGSVPVRVLTSETKTITLLSPVGSDCGVPAPSSHIMTQKPQTKSYISCYIFTSNNTNEDQPCEEEHGLRSRWLPPLRLWILRKDQPPSRSRALQPGSIGFRDFTAVINPWLMEPLVTGLTYQSLAPHVSEVMGRLIGSPCL